MLNKQQLVSLAKRNANNAKKVKQTTKEIELTDEVLKKTYWKYFNGQYRSLEHNPNGNKHSHLQIFEMVKHPNHYVVEVVCVGDDREVHQTGVAYIIPKSGYIKGLGCGILIKL